ncbi:hypothetical protein AB0K18_42570 [Nonomuraea sp. NPDC049421]|uniref:hypothetical protein n=1 Tax=Nonomuraea sp. NPDC049421 TaxID=3155275 RepID=UPI00341F46BC
MTSSPTIDQAQETGRYLYLLQRLHAFGDLADLRPWLITICIQCGKPGSDAPHLTIGGFVAIGCGGYFQIDPNALGMDMPDWDDWTRVKPDVQIGPWRPTSAAADDPGVTAKATITVELVAPAGAPTSERALHRELLDHLDGHQFEVQHDPTEDPNGYTMVEVRTR